MKGAQCGTQSRSPGSSPGQKAVLNSWATQPTPQKKILRERMGGGRAEGEADAGLNPRTLESWPEPKSRVGHLTNQATQGPKILFLSNLYTQHGVWIYNPKIKSHMLHQLSQPSSPMCMWILILRSCVQAPLSREPDRGWGWGSIPGPRDHDQSWRQMLNWLRHPGDPTQDILKVK